MLPPSQSRNLKGLSGCQWSLPLLAEQSASAEFNHADLTGVAAFQLGSCREKFAENGWAKEPQPKNSNAAARAGRWGRYRHHRRVWRPWEGHAGRLRQGRFSGQTES